jgi:hypothetical protein
MQTDDTLLASLSEMKLLEEERGHRDRRHPPTLGPFRVLAEGASPPDTPTKELIRRSAFLAISTMTVFAGALWALMYVSLGEYLAAAMPAIYSACTGAILVTCVCRPILSASEGGGGTGRGYDFFVDAQLGMILLLPFAVHVALGGVERSGCVMLWSFLCPVGAAFFRSTGEGLIWYRRYMIINVALLAGAFWDATTEGGGGSSSSSSSSSAASSSSETIRKLYFLMNIVGVKCVIFAAVYLFARELETEYAKSEEMLLNILPSSIVRRIKRGEFPIVDHVSDVTILFADLGEFSISIRSELLLICVMVGLKNENNGARGARITTTTTTTSR